MASELEHTFAPKGSHTFRVGPYARAGWVVVSASTRNPSELYVSNLRVGNWNRMGGSPGVGTPLEFVCFDRDMTSFPVGLPLTIEMHNRSDHEVRVSLAVLAD